MIKHWMSKVGDPKCGLTVTKTAHITKNGESYNNVHENAVPTVLNKPSASQNQRVVSDLSDLQARLFKEYVGLFPNVSTETVFTEARLDANTLFIKGTKDIVNLVDDKSLAFAYNKTNLKRPIIGLGIIVEGLPHLIPMVLDKYHRWIGKLL